MKYIFVGCLMLAYLSGKCQQFGGNPPALKWRQFNNDTVRVIFHPGLDSLALNITRTAQMLARQTSATIGKRIRKVNIVLQDQTVLSNGYVALGPFRSEFYLTPEQNSFDLGSLPWWQSLAIHEYRHVQQFSNFRVGGGRLLYYLAGELGQSLANSAAIPNWFWEGDAVCQETYVSQQGRGRLPSFFDGYRSLWASGKNYSWLKLRNGSLRDYVPDHYRLGYMLTAYGREKYGADFWRKVTQEAAAFRGLTYPFQQAVLRNSGLKYSLFTSQAQAYFREQFSSSGGDSISALAAGAGHFLGDEEYPQWVDKDQLVFLSGSYRKNPAFVVRDLRTGSERTIRKADITSDGYFSYHNGKIIYAAYHPDLRWGWKSYSDLQIVEVETGKQVRLTHGSRLFSPDISADGQQVAAVEVAPGGESRIRLLGTAGRDGGRLLPNPHHYFYTYPKFFGAADLIAAVRNDKGQMALLKIHLSDGSEEVLLPFGPNVIGFPQVSGDTIVLSASWGKRDRIFMLVGERLFLFDPANYNHSTGNYQPALRDASIAWSAFSSAGRRLLVDSSALRDLLPVDLQQWQRPLPEFGIGWLDSGRNIRKSWQDTVYANGEVYHKAHRLFNFHSWIPNVNDPDYTVSLLGENVINTLQSELYFTYNTADRTRELGARATYGALYTWLRAGADFIFDRKFLFRQQLVRFSTREFYGGLSLPLNLSGGKYVRTLQATSDYVYSQSNPEPFFKDSLRFNSLGYLRSVFQFSNFIQQARQHILPRWGQSLLFRSYESVSLTRGSQVMVSGNLYFPGIWNTHNLVINGAFHWRDTLNQVRYTNSFPFSRGYVSYNYPEMIKWGVNYHFPLFYPDAGFGNMVYILRVRSNLFYDHTRVIDIATGGQRLQADFRSMGVELNVDSKWWNEHPVSFGFRLSRLLDVTGGGSGWRFEFILPVNLINR